MQKRNHLGLYEANVLLGSGTACEFWRVKHDVCMQMEGDEIGADGE
jgi:hypothetical protein